MTAINVLRQRHRAVMLTDTAGYDIDGVVRGFGQKSFTIPHLRTVIATRGSIMAATLIGLSAGLRFRSFDDLVSAEGEEFIAAEHERMVDDLSMSGQSHLDLLIAGWSESENRPKTFALSTDEVNGIGVFKWTDTDALMVFPDCDIELAKRFGMVNVASAEEIDPVAHGIALMQAQRHTAYPLRNDIGQGENRFLVGGAIVMSEVRQEGVTQRVIHRWDEDTIGQPIKPGPLPVGQTRQLGANELSAPMSRQQRRAAEREARKRA